MALSEPTELDQSRLLRMKLQLEVRQPFPKLPQEPLCVLTMLEANHQIVCIADHHKLSARHFPAPYLNPQIKDVMQIHIRQQR
jgi:hypothetical protein